VKKTLEFFSKLNKAYRSLPQEEEEKQLFFLSQNRNFSFIRFLLQYFLSKQIYHKKLYIVFFFHSKSESTDNMQNGAEEDHCS
jgi:predicted glycosyltransferase involved in capsule biosynthesis